MQSLVWSDGERILRVDCRLYAKAQDQQSKNDPARAMLAYVKEGDFVPALVMLDRPT